MKRFLLLSFFAFCVATFVWAQDFAPRVGATADLAPFYHGVASGDPTASSVIIWTRVTPETDGAKTVNWRVAADTNFTQIVKSGLAVADSSADYTIKIDVTGLEANRWFYYDFETDGKRSIIGRTRTAPAANVQELRFGIVSCSNYAKGFFNVYARLGERNDIDAILHLGDYIYEGDNKNNFGRSHIPQVVLKELDQFRIRYGQYKMDPDLIFLHQQYPWIMVWDDHETSNNTWKEGSPTWNATVFPGVKAAATQVYFEWTPIRPDSANFGRIYRDVSFGPLVELFMLDTRREGREKQVSQTDSLQLNDPNRTLLGHEQLDWLTQKLKNSAAKWKILGQQVMMAPLRVDNYPLNMDQWDGYPAERTKLLNFIDNNNIDNVVVITGDIHQSWASDLPANEAAYDSTTGAGSVAVEFVTPSVASNPGPLNMPFYDIKAENVHLQHSEMTRSGYIVLSLTNNKVQGDFYNIPTILKPSSQQTFTISLRAMDGENHLQRLFTPATPLVQYPALAPFAEGYSPTVTGLTPEKRSSFFVLGLYPNPTSDAAVLSCYVPKKQNLTLEIFDISGKLMKTETFANTPEGMQELVLGVGELPAGVYQTRLKAEKEKLTFFKMLVVSK